MTSKSSLLNPETETPTIPDGLLEDLQSMIDQTRKSVASTVNAGLTLLYWRVGERIHKEILLEERGKYGQKIVASLSRQLTKSYGNACSEKNLRRMIQFAEVFPDESIVVSLIRQLSWTHFIALIPIKETIKRDFYAEMCRIEGWNVRTLRIKIDSIAESVQNCYVWPARKLSRLNNR